MTYKEAIDTIVWTPLMRSESDHGELKEALFMAVEAIEKADKYRWHDLRKDPTDLPQEKTMCLICYENKFFIDYDYDAAYYKDHSFGIIDVNKVVAWKEIKPFEEES